MDEDEFDEMMEKIYQQKRDTCDAALARYSEDFDLATLVYSLWSARFEEEEIRVLAVGAAFAHYQSSVDHWTHYVNDFLRVYKLVDSFGDEQTESVLKNLLQLQNVKQTKAEGD